MTIIQLLNDTNSPANPNLGVQKFLGLTVVDINCNSSWDSQGGQCVINLIQDPDENEVLDNVIVGSPQYFEIVDLNGNPIFRFYGILKELSRSANPNSKMYSATLQSPTLLLEASSIITKGFTGAGGAYEAYGPNILAKINFGSNNENIDSNKIFNVLNVFGLYENSEYGSQNAGFGNSAITEEGIRVDYFGYAIDQLVNGGIGTPKLGSNIIYGASSYDSPNAYAYNFDILGFLQQIVTFIPDDYRVTATNLMEFVSQICESINHVFYIDLLKPSGSGNPAFGSGHTSTVVPNLTHPNTIYGGQIVVVIQNRNVISNKKFPLSEYIISKEISDKGGSGQNQDLPLDIGLTGSFHPDGPPVGNSLGTVPVDELTLEDFEKLKSSSLSVNLNEGAVAAKVIAGGFQSRINYIKSINTDNVSSPSVGTQDGIDSDLSHDVYQYWGDINVTIRNTISPNSPFQKNVPVLTPLQTHNLSLNSPNSNVYETSDIIAIDCIDIIGRFTSPSTNGVPIFVDGVYLASIGELKAAAQSHNSWLTYMQFNKGTKFLKFQSIFGAALNVKFRTYTGDTLNYLGMSVDKLANHWVGLYNLRANNLGESRDCNLNNAAQLGFQVVSQMLVEKFASIYNECYGKKYAVKVPAYSVKINPDWTPSNVQDYVKPSWEISEDGFLDPVKWDEYFAPQGDFISSGRIKAYANFETNSEQIRLIHCNNIISSPAGQYRSYKDFSEYGQDKSLYMRPVFYEGVSTIVSVPVQVEKQYITLPNLYFSIYSPHTQLGSISGKRSSGAFRDIDAEMSGLRTFLLNLVLTHADAGGIPFALVTLPNAVNLPTTDKINEDPCKASDDSVKDRTQLQELYMDQMKSSTQDRDNEVYYRTHPIGFGIPQQSNRYVYGPWVTNNTLNYGAKIEYEQLDDLVPENYLNYSTMNTVAQLLANSVENFDFLYVEQGSISMAGLPKVTHLGQSLVENGPLVSDISINVSASEITTNYSMKTFAPKFGRIGKYYADKITKIISKIKG